MAAIESLTEINLSVVNLKGWKAKGVEYIGRSYKVGDEWVNGSALGNEFRLGKRIGVSEIREHSIDLYSEWLKKYVILPGLRNERFVDCRFVTKHFGEVVISGKRNWAAWQELRRLCDLYKDGFLERLGCWCAPLACHGDVIVKAIKWLVESGYV